MQQLPEGPPRASGFGVVSRHLLVGAAAAVALLAVPARATAEEAVAATAAEPAATAAEPAATAAEPAATARAKQTTPLRWGEANRAYRIRAVGEIGFLAVADHHVQFGSDGTDIDYVAEGGQENLYLAWRLSVELALFRQHQILFLYQPLQLATDAIAGRDLVVDELTFPEGSPVEFTYGFPFYRLSYLYDIFADPRLEVSVGVSLQIRNATILFTSGDGALYRSERDIGFVPLLKLRVMYALENGFWFGTEIDGIYAPVSYLNGSDNEIVGALVDWSLRAGLNLPRNVQAFLNVRYLGGGATGTNPDDPGPGDGYVRNWLHFITVTLGVNWDII